MSRGPGRVMREVLETLERYGRASTGELCAAVFPLGGEAAQVSTRRALRSLTARGAVCSLGFNASGERVYCFPGERGRFVCLLADEVGGALFVERFGWIGRKYRAGFVRLWNSSRAPLSAEQVHARTERRGESKP